MICSSFPTDAPCLVADASVVISLNATRCAGEIIDSIKTPLVVTRNAVIELESGIRNGHGDAEQLHRLTARGYVQIVEVGPSGLAVYERLIEGRAGRTLDDGEAATIACAVERTGLAILDERKARSLFSSEFPASPMASTAEILLSGAVENALGKMRQIEAMVRALQNARMRVPLDHLEAVLSLIGKDNAALCPSLPASLRRR